VGEPFQWANRTWFYPDQRVSTHEINEGLAALGMETPMIRDSLLQAKDAFLIAAALGGADPGEGGRSAKWSELGLGNYDPMGHITRGEFARLLARMADPFGRFQVDHKGRILK
jgi:hypothetical protein